MRPNPNSRVMLDDKRDALGLPRAKLDWRLTDTDKTTIRIAQEELSLAFGAAGLGRVKTVFREAGPWPSTIQGGNHHMGTTRMSADPRTGVVDSDCRVHGLANLWIGGSSVFPTTGTSNPTLTILALALRLASHLKERMA
jgi:choline dehydrogenase-like flavoprotein